MSSLPRPTGGRPVPAASGMPVYDRTAVRLMFLIPGGIALLLGLNAGLLLLGVWAPLSFATLARLHAPLMVFGFIGTLVLLERAVAVRRGWAYLSPALLGIGSLTLISDAPEQLGKSMIVLGFVVLLAIYLLIWRRSPAIAVEIQGLGAVAGLSAAVLWLGGAAIWALVPGMAVFLILTIAGERLELARISPRVDARAEQLALAASALMLLSVLLATLWPEWGHRALGAALLVLIGWLMVYDVATRLVRSTGLPRYMAACLLAGYGWLLVAGGIWLGLGIQRGGPDYDAVLHAVFVGFVLSMIMAHAPVILPAVLRRPLPYRAVFYAPVALLHLSVLLRLLLGDGLGQLWALRWGGILNAVSIVLFLLLALGSSLLGPPRRPGADAAAAAPERASLTADEQEPR